MSSITDFPPRAFFHVGNMLLDDFFSIGTLAIVCQNIGYAKGEVDQIEYDSRNNELFMHHYLYCTLTEQCDAGKFEQLEKPLLLLMVLRELINQTGEIEEQQWSGFFEVRGVADESQPILCRIFFEHYQPANAPATFSYPRFEVSDLFFQGEWDSSDSDEQYIRDMISLNQTEYVRRKVIASRVSLYDNGTEVEVGRTVEERELVEVDIEEGSSAEFQTE